MAHNDDVTLWDIPMGLYTGHNNTYQTQKTPHQLEIHSTHTMPTCQISRSSASIRNAT